MRKSLAVAAVLAILVLPTASAHAAPRAPDLRDPFRPLLSAATDDTTATSNPGTDDPGVDDPSTVGDPDPAPPADDGLPATGTETANWLAAAYVLVAIGGALLTFGCLSGPRRRRLGT